MVCDSWFYVFFFLWLTNKRKIIETKKGWAVVFYAALSTLTKSFSAAIVELFLSVVTPSDKQKNEGHVQGQVSSAAGSGQRPRAHWVPRAPVQRADRHCSICLVRDFAALLLQDDGQVKDPRRTLAGGRWERKKKKKEKNEGGCDRVERPPLPTHLWEARPRRLSLVSFFFVQTTNFCLWEAKGGERKDTIQIQRLFSNDGTFLFGYSYIRSTSVCLFGSFFFVFLFLLRQKNGR